MMDSDSELLARIEDAEAAISKRARSLLVVGLLGILAGFVVLGIYLDSARAKAERARDEAIEVALNKTATANAAADALVAIELALNEGDERRALELVRIARGQQELAAEAPLPEGSQDVAARPEAAASDQPQVASALRDAAASSEQGLSLPKFAAAGDRRVFIQFAGEIARGEIIRLNEALRQAGWNVQGASGERIATAAGLNEVRFSSEDDRPAAEALAEALSEARVGSTAVRARQVAIIRPGTLEVWISR